MTADELVKAVVTAMNAAAVAAYKQNPGIPDEEYDAVKARAAIRAVHEAMRELSAEMVSAFHKAEAEDADVGVFADTVRQNNERLCRAVWPAMLAASPLAEVARDDR